MSRDIKPLVPVNPEGLDEIAEALLNETSQGDGSPNFDSSKIIQPERYILLPEGKYGNHDYPNILVGMQRLSAEPKIVQVAQRLGLAVGNNAQGFIGSINPQNALDLNKGAGYFTLPVVLFREFLKLLKDGTDGKTKVYNGKGELAPQQLIKQTLDNIVAVADPWRAEWFADRYSTQSGALSVTYPIFRNGKIEDTTEALGDCLMKDKTPRINFDEWLKNATPHGLPMKGIKKGELYYWNPRPNTVARFIADSGGAYLYCDWGPSGTYSSLGVRAAIAAPNARNLGGK